MDRRCTGLEVALHSRSLSATPMAALSRAVAGIRDSSLIVNFPGSVKAVKVLRLVQGYYGHEIKVTSQITGVLGGSRAGTEPRGRPS